MALTASRTASKGHSLAPHLAALALGLTALMLGTPTQAQQTIKIATEGTYPPWTFSNPQGGVQGFEVDVANESCKRLNLTCELVIQDFPGFIPGLLAGKFDVVLSALSVTEERKKIVDFTRPYARIDVSFVVPNDSPLTKLPGKGERYHLDTEPEVAKRAIDAILPHLKGVTLGTQTGSVSAKFVAAYLKDSVGRVNEYKSTRDQDIDLSNGRTDIVVGSIVALTKSLSTPPLQGFGFAGPSFGGGVVGTGYGAAFRKSDTELRESFDRVLGDMISDGTIRKISDRWIGIDVTP